MADVFVVLLLFEALFQLLTRKLFIVLQGWTGPSSANQPEEVSNGTAFFWWSALFYTLGKRLHTWLWREPLARPWWWIWVNLVLLKDAFGQLMYGWQVESLIFKINSFGLSILNWIEWMNEWMNEWIIITCSLTQFTLFQLQTEI